MSTKTIEYRKLDSFTRSYIEAALWSTTDNADESGGEPLDANHDWRDIHPDTLSKMAEDCLQFQDDNRADLDETGRTESRLGFCFWLNRNRHGSGFWDEGSESVFQKLSDASKAWGTFDLYLGDDGMIHGS